MQLFSNEMMQALCWTLIHSLWQGLAAAAVAALMIALTRKSKPGLRYNLLAMVFVLFLITAGITFATEWRSAQPEPSGIATVTLPVQPAHYPATLSATGERTDRGFGNLFVSYFNTHAPLVVLIWMIVWIAQSVRLLANAVYLQRVSHIKTQPAPVYWQQKLKELADRLHISTPVSLLQTARVDVPMVVGLIKPVILFPFSLLSQLPPEQVEAVLLHELAHVRRNDYVVNLLQRIAELFFFFNPGLLWISTMIRDERENCCDDMAIAETNDKKQFIHALVSFQEYTLARNSCGLAFPGRSNRLLDRVKRILTNNNKTLNTMEKVFLACSLFIAGTCAIAFTSTAKQPAGTPTTQQSKQDELTVTGRQRIETVTDTLPAKHSRKSQSVTRKNGTVIYIKDGYKITMKDDQLTELVVDGKKKPADQWDNYRDNVEIVVRGMKKEMTEQQDQLELQELKLKEQQELLNREMDEVKERQAMEEGGTIRILRDDQDQHLLEKEKLDKLQEALQREQEEIMRSSKDGKLEPAQQAAMIKLQREELQLVRSQLKLQQARLNRAIPPVPPIDPLSTPVIKLDVRPIAPIPPVPLALDSKPISSIVDDLLDEKVISSRENLTFTLNPEVLEVNGVKQPEELHKKFRDRYAPGTNDHVIYSTHKGSTHADVNVNK